MVTLLVPVPLRVVDINDLVDVAGTRMVDVDKLFELLLDWVVVRYDGIVVVGTFGAVVGTIGAVVGIFGAVVGTFGGKVNI